MIEPTDEMLTAAFDACEDPATEVEEADLRRMVAAILALVERDYNVSPRPSQAKPDGPEMLSGEDWTRMQGSFPACDKPIGNYMLCARPRGHSFPPCGIPDPDFNGRELAS